MNFLQKIYKKSKEQKGFTLVEMIVVLVIIAILAAITIPALIKYIDKARDKQIVIDARTAYLAAETTISEAYASNTTIPASLEFTNTDTTGLPGSANELTGVTKKYKCIVTIDTSNNNSIKQIQFGEGGKTAIMTTAGGSWIVSPQAIASGY